MRGKHSDPYVHCANKKESPNPLEVIINLFMLAAVLWVLYKVLEVIVDEVIIPFIKWVDRGITRGCNATINAFMTGCRAIDKKMGWTPEVLVQRPVVGKYEGTGSVRPTDNQNKSYFSDSAWHDGPPHAPRLRLTR